MVYAFFSQPAVSSTGHKLNTLSDTRFSKAIGLRYSANTAATTHRTVQYKQGSGQTG